MRRSAKLYDLRLVPVATVSVSGCPEREPPYALLMAAIPGVDALSAKLSFMVAVQMRARK